MSARWAASCWLSLFASRARLMRMPVDASSRLCWLAVPASCCSRARRDADARSTARLSMSDVKIVPDQFRHEPATAYNLKGRGLVILTACSHRGVVNTIKQAQAASGVTKVHAVIGGFHLAPYAEDYVRQTIAALKDMDVDYVIPLHCSGEVFYDLAQSEIPTKLLRSYMGSRFVFQAA